MEMRTHIGVAILFRTDILIDQVGINSSFKEFMSKIVSKWNELANVPIEIFVVREEKRVAIENDTDLQSVACFGIMKQHEIVEIHVVQVSTMMIEGPSTNNNSSPELTTCENLRLMPREPLKSSGWANIFKSVEQVFRGVEEFRESLLKYSQASGYKYKFKKNDKERVTVVCARKEETNCAWRIHASLRYANGVEFQIKRMTNIHTCGACTSSSKNSRNSTKFYKKLIIDEVKDKPTTRPIDLKSRLRRDYGLEVNYYSAHTAKKLALKEVLGDVDSSYHHLITYLDSFKEASPDSYVAFVKDPITNQFQRLFIAFGASRHGFEHCPPVLFLDGTFLKGRFKGCLMGATAKDGNGGIYPYAFGIVGSENDDNWEWFLDHLKLAILSERELTFISDRHTGLVKHVPLVFPRSYHSYCYWHLKNNVNTKIAGRKKAEKKEIKDLFERCAYARTHKEFTPLYDRLKEIGGSRMVKFLSKLELYNWTSAYFKGKRYGDLCSNVAESFNHWILEGREYPITALVDFIRKKVMQIFTKRRQISSKWETTLCPKKEKKLQEGLDAAKMYRLQRCSISVFEVQGRTNVYRVDLSSSYCSCNIWHIYGFPCYHAIACFKSLGSDIKSLGTHFQSIYDIVDPCFRASSYRTAYSLGIEPVVHDAIIAEAPNDVLVLPPDVAATHGRPPKKRIPNTGTVLPKKGKTLPKRKVTCQRCLGSGHNKRSCTREIVETNISKSRSRWLSGSSNPFTSTGACGTTDSNASTSATCFSFTS